MNFKRLIYNAYNDERLLLVLIFFISIFISLIFLFFFGNVGPREHRIPGPDYLNYYEPIADSIIQGKGIPIREEFAIRYPPGYPIFLSLIFGLSKLLEINRLELVVIFNVIATAFACSILFFLVKSILNKKIALVSVFLWATYPFNLWFIKNPNTEVPFIPLFFAALFAYIMAFKKNSFRLFLLCGIFMGLASLIRPITVFLPVFLLVLLFYIIKFISCRKKFLLAVALLIGYAAIILPWLIYVYLNVGKIIPLSTGGSSNIPAGLTFMVDKNKMNNGIGEEGKMVLPSDITDLIKRVRVINKDSSGEIIYFFQQEIENHPITFLKLVAIKMARAWYATSEMWWEKQILLIQLAYLIPAIAGAMIWFKKIKEKKSHLLLLLTVVFYFWAMTTISLSIMRYMVPIMGLIMVFAAITIFYLLEKIKNIFIHGNRSNYSGISF
ncbi:MAG: glycosyltransferase family 39 protein [Patescibacteria group bacterium]